MIQMRKLNYSQLFAGRTNEPSVLADKLKRMAPFDAGKVFFGLSGSDANDTQIKLIWYYNNALGRPEKKKIISRKRGYHGVTTSGSLTGLPPFMQPLTCLCPASCIPRHRITTVKECLENHIVTFCSDW